MGDHRTGIRITLQGVDDAAVEMAADELKQRLGARFAVTGRRRRGPEGLSITATMLVAAAANVDAAAADLLDRLYAGQVTGMTGRANGG